MQKQKRLELIVQDFECIRNALRFAKYDDLAKNIETFIEGMCPADPVDLVGIVDDGPAIDQDRLVLQHVRDLKEQLRAKLNKLEMMTPELNYFGPCSRCGKEITRNLTVIDDANYCSKCAQAGYEAAIDSIPNEPSVRVYTRDECECGAAKLKDMTHADWCPARRQS